MKLGQLIEYSMRNNFHKESFTKYCGETIPRHPYPKNQNWAYLWIKCLKFYAVYFYCFPSWGLLEYIKTKLKTTWFYLIQSFFNKQKEAWNWSPCHVFCIIFEVKYSSCLLSDQIPWSDCLYLVRYSAISVLQLFVNQSLRRHKFWNEPYLSNKAAFSNDLKVKIKN